MLGDDLQYFLTLASTGTMTNAAEQLGISQPALTKAVQRLEQKVGARLLIRSSRGAELTEAGRAFRDRLQAASRNMEDAVQEARNLGGIQAGILRIGVTPATTDFVLRALLPALTIERPAARISVVTAFSSGLMDNVARREIELAVCPAPDALESTLECETLYEDPCSLMLNSKHPLAQQARISLEDIVKFAWAGTGKHEFTRTQLKRVFAAHGLSLPPIVVEADTLAALILIVSRTQLVSMINVRSIRATSLPENVVIKPLPFQEMNRRIAIVRQSGYLSPIGQRACELLRDAAQEDRVVSEGMKHSAV